ncbi:MAG: hypothetical protein PF795_03870 [Kiritimatiellae bacterium]|jgi:glutathione synthase/RimK-type ligase-like ATP-grasp enzyme|nr:hypothetical protein [Kiritimatiellia bacterium]
MNSSTIFFHSNNGFCRKLPEIADKLCVPNVGGWIYDHYPEILEKNFDAVVWSLNHENPLDMQEGRLLLYSLEQAGVKVFPNHSSCWHFDDKIAQQLLLKSIEAPIPDYSLFYRREDALNYVRSASYPLVFKLRKGAGAINVKLVRTPSEAKMFVRKMFGSGIRQHPPIEGLKRGISRSKKNREKKDPLPVRARRAARLWVEKLLRAEKERGYVFFQEFIPDQTHDTRVTVIGNRAFVYERGVRDNDFRASGSGKNNYLQEADIPVDMTDIALDISKKMGFQSMAYDFVSRPGAAEPVILEMCFTFIPDYIEKCMGYMTPDHTWVEGHFRPERFILEDLLADA